MFNLKHLEFQPMDLNSPIDTSELDISQPSDGLQIPISLDTYCQENEMLYNSQEYPFVRLETLYGLDFSDLVDFDLY